MRPLADHRFAALDGLRAVSIVLVLATHMLPLGPKSFRINETTGPMGMSLFFGLSGFLITQQLLANNNVRDFLVRRCARIIPLAYLYILVVFAAITWDPNRLFWSLTFLVNYLTGHLNAYNSHFWSLCVEMQFYASIALVVGIAGKRGLWVVFPGCILLTGLRIAGSAYVDIATHLRADEILAGACVGLAYGYGSRCPKSHVLYAGLVLLWLASSSPMTKGLQYLRPYASALLIFATLSHEQQSWIGKVLATRAMRYVAAISYALYVIHAGLIQGWWNEGSVFQRYGFKRPLSFALTFLFAHLSTFHWERFWIEMAKNWISKRALPSRISNGLNPGPSCERV